MISKEQLEEFKKLYKEKFNEELSDQDALEKATDLTRLIEIILDDYIEKELENR